MVYCTDCGAANGDHARFCAKCGAKLLTRVSAGATPVAPAAKGRGGRGLGFVAASVVVAACVVAYCARNGARPGGVAGRAACDATPAERRSPNGRAPQEGPAEKRAWALAEKSGTPAAYDDFRKAYPDSRRMTKRTGTLRGRYWCRLDDAARLNGVLVTAEGAGLMARVTLEEAERQGLVGSRLATAGLVQKARGRSFRHLYAEVVEGGYVVAQKFDGEVAKVVVEPRDLEGATLFLSADGAKLLTWDLARAVVCAKADTRPTYRAGKPTANPFDDLPRELRATAAAESQDLDVTSSADE